MSSRNKEGVGRAGSASASHTEQPSASLRENIDQEIFMTRHLKENPATPTDGSVSRRGALAQSAAGVAVLACALGGCATSMKVQGNTSKMEAQYQDHPNGLERCGVCKHFIPLSGCEVVVAPVQANGWCRYYALL